MFLWDTFLDQVIQGIQFFPSIAHTQAV